VKIRRLLLITSLFLGFLSGASAVHAARKINCDGQFAFEKAKLDLTADILKKITVDLKKDNTTLAKVNEWTTVVLDQQRALCDAYKASDEKTFSTEQYLIQLDKLRNWELDFFKSVLSLTKVEDSKESNKAGASEELKKNLKSLEDNLDTLLSQTPKADIPK
jgi:hypothetical protein